MQPIYGDIPMEFTIDSVYRVEIDCRRVIWISGFHESPVRRYLFVRNLDFIATFAGVNYVTAKN